MYHPPTRSRYFLYAGFLAVCILSFLVTCCTFFLYRLLIRPLIFLLIFTATLPLIGRELLKKEVPRQKIEQPSKDSPI